MDSIAWINGNFITMDASRPRAQALVTRGGRIVFAGSSAQALATAGAGAESRDMGGRTVVPGFNDNHVHAVFLGDHAFAPNLGGLDARSIVALLKERFPSPEPGVILRAFNWDYPACPEPHRRLLDEAFPRNPVVLGQFSGHAQWLNSAALAVLGISRRKPYRGAGQVLLDSAGEPTGIVRDLGETALSRKRVHQNYFLTSVREPRLAYALDTFRRYGITSVQDNTWYYPELFSLARLHHEGRLTARFTTWSLGRRPWSKTAMDAVYAAGSIPGLRLPWLPRPKDRDFIRPGPVKYFLDGAFSTRTACLGEPYADDPAGGMCADPELPVRELEFLASHRSQGAFHAIGDRGIRILLDAVEKVRESHPGMDRLRIRIEHAQLIRPEDIPRIKKLGLLVAAQPMALCDPEKDERLLGPERARRAYPYRSLLDAGVPLSFGSDIPGESGCDPLYAIHLAVNRSGPERIGVEEAIRCYTAGSAYAEFMEERKGILAPGMLADFAVLSSDITSIPSGLIAGTKVEETVVGGVSVFDRAAG